MARCEQTGGEVATKIGRQVRDAVDRADKEPHGVDSEPGLEPLAELGAHRDEQAARIAAQHAELVGMKDEQQLYHQRRQVRRAAPLPQHCLEELPQRGWHHCRSRLV